VTELGLAALLWIKPPGESDGPCRGEPGFGFSAAQARRLIATSPWVPEPDRRRAATAAIP
jgi:cellulase/cellobiase CelA1